METNQEVIGNRTFSFGTIPAEEAVFIEVSVARVIGEPLFKAFMNYKPKTQAGKKPTPAEKAEKRQEMMQAGVAAIGMLTSKMDAGELLATMKTVLKYVTCDGLRVEINTTFTGRNRELWEVFIAALRFNFSEFFTGSLFTSIQDDLSLE